MKNLIGKILSNVLNLLRKTEFFSYFEINRYYSDFYTQELMLADKVRIDTYYKGITRLVKPGDTVLDIGTGTGILSFFAARTGAKKVYAIDLSDIISTAKRVAAHNKIDNIEFIKTNSRDFVLDSPVDVIVHEQIAPFIFEEYMVETICDVRDRLLKKDGIIIPSLFEFFIEPVKVKDSLHIPFIREQKIHDIDFTFLEAAPSDTKYHIIYYRDGNFVDYLLCDPEPVYRFDLKNINPADIPKVFNYSRRVIRGGRLDGFVVYFRCIFDEETEFITSPIAPHVHWRYGLIRVESEVYEKGQPIQFELKADSLKNISSWHWSHK